jgi:hypothetical protein
MKFIKLCSIIFIISILTTIFSFPVQADSSEESAQEKALQFVSNQSTISVSELGIINTYPFTNESLEKDAEIIVIQEIDDHEGRIWKIAVTSSGKVMNSNEYLKKLSAEHQEKYDKLSPDLYEFLQSKSSDDMVKVGIWLTSDATAAADTVAAKYPGANLKERKPTKDTDIEIFQKIQMEMNEAMKRAYKASEQPIIELVKENDFEVFGTADYAPIVFAELPMNMERGSTILFLPLAYILSLESK